MTGTFADDFGGIPVALAANGELRKTTLQVVANATIHAKVVDGFGRVDAFREIARQLVDGRFELAEAIRQTEARLARQSSPHAGDNRVFASGWAERLVRTQVSRYYNQAVLETLLAAGEARCFVPHSRAEKPESPCSQHLANAEHDAKTLYDRLIDQYENGNWSKDVVKIPDHPHCTHVVRPASKTSG